MQYSVRQRVTVGGLVCLMAFLAPGCKSPAPPVPPEQQPKWPTLPIAAVPDFMHGTILERVRFGGTEPQKVYGYSLAVNLHGTGDSTAPSWVRQYIEKEILIHGFGSAQMHKYAEMTPEEILNDKRVAIVIVEGDIPVGIKAGDRFDVIVHATPRSYTTSLAHGELYETPLSEHGLQDPSGTGAHPEAVLQGGQIFVNPAYALSEGNPGVEGSRASLRTGTVLNGAIAKYTRPIYLQLRQPQASASRRIEELIQRRWHGVSPIDPSADRSKVVAAAQDEGLVEIYVPDEYNGDWKHFVGVVSHMYLDDAPEFTIAKARELVTEAHKPGAPLTDISLCWEAMGPDALPIFQPLISDPDPNIAFAAARAAVFLGDEPSRLALLEMASDPSHPDQMEAVRTLGLLPSTPETRHMLRSLLDSDRAEARIEAYKILADSGEGIVSHKIGDNFILDVVESDGPPMVYATTTGVPRLAIFGHDLTLETPITFLAMDSRFSISSSDDSKLLSLFYRDPTKLQPTDVLSHNDLIEILARLGGEGPDEDDTFNFNFNDVVAIAQQLVAQNRVYGTRLTGERVACVFELQHQQLESDGWTSVPRDNTAGRPQGTNLATPQPTPRAQTPVAAPGAAPAVPPANDGFHPGGS
jgi:flagellar basal body P-ring protein FlgI